MAELLGRAGILFGRDETGALKEGLSHALRADISAALERAQTDHAVTLSWHCPAEPDPTALTTPVPSGTVSPTPQHLSRNQGKPSEPVIAMPAVCIRKLPSRRRR